MFIVIIKWKFDLGTVGAGYQLAVSAIGFLGHGTASPW